MKAVLLVSAAIALSALLLIAFPGSDNPQMVRFLILSQIAFAGYWVFLLVAKRRPKIASSQYVVVPLIVALVVIRVLVPLGAGEQADLSDDVYRYVWEGKIVSQGYNPYVLSPTDLSETAFADSTIYPKINHPWLPTIYPPVSQILFAFAHMIGGDSLQGFKLLSIIFELLTLLTIFLLVREFCLPNWHAMIYALSPLVLIEFLYSNHLDILAMPFFVLSIILLKRENAPWSAAALAMAVLVKLLAILVFPVFFLFFTGKRKLIFTGTFVGIILLFYLPFLITSGWQVFGSLWTYLGTWQYNGSIFSLLSFVVSPAIARGICVGMFVLISAFALFYKRKDRPPVTQMLWIFGAYIVFTPSLFPWYMIWLLPLLVVRPNAAIITLTGTVMLSYHVLIGYYANGSWSQYPLLQLLEYLPFFVLLLWQGIVQRRNRKPLLT